MRANSVLRPTKVAGAWISAVRGLASISRTSAAKVSPLIRLSASRHHHIIVMRAPILAEVLDVAALAAAIAVAVAIKNARFGLKAGAQLLPCHFLGDPVGGIGEIAEDEKIKAASRRDGIEDRLHAGKNPRHVLVVNRHQDGGAR